MLLQCLHILECAYRYAVGMMLALYAHLFWCYMLYHDFLCYAVLILNVLLWFPTLSFAFL